LLRVLELLSCWTSVGTVPPMLPEVEPLLLELPEDVEPEPPEDVLLLLPPVVPRLPDELPEAVLPALEPLEAPDEADVEPCPPEEVRALEVDPLPPPAPEQARAHIQVTQKSSEARRVMAGASLTVLPQLASPHEIGAQAGGCHSTST
jgi:hypothetical protein